MNRGAQSQNCFRQLEYWTQDFLQKVRHEKIALQWILGLLNVHKIPHYFKIKVPRYNIKLNFIVFWGKLVKNGLKICSCPFCKNTNILSFMLPPNCLISRIVGEGSQNFLPEPDSS